MWLTFRNNNLPACFWNNIYLPKQEIDYPKFFLLCCFPKLWAEVQSSHVQDLHWQTEMPELEGITTVLRKETDPVPEDCDAETEQLVSSDCMGKYPAEVLPDFGGQSS